MPSQNQVGAILANSYDSASRSIREGGRATGAGIASMGNSIGRGISQGAFLAEDRKKKDGVAKAFRNMIDADPDLAASLGIDPANMDDYSTNDILGATQALKMKSQIGETAMIQAAQKQALNERQKVNTLADRLLRTADGEGKGVLTPEAQALAKRFAESPAGQARRMGVTLTPEMITRYGGASQKPAFSPEIVDMAGGRQAMTTSPSSAQLIPQDDAVAPPQEGGPTMSADGRFYLDGDSWKPLRSQIDGLDPLVRETYVKRVAILRSEIAELQKQAAKTPTDPMGPNFLRTTRDDVNKKIQEKRQELAAKEAALGGGAQMGNAATAPPPQAAPTGGAFNMDGLIF